MLTVLLHQLVPLDLEAVDPAERVLHLADMRPLCPRRQMRLIVDCAVFELGVSGEPVAT